MLRKPEIEQEHKPIRIPIEPPVMPYGEQKLRERKQKQIQHQKWEEAERKRILEEERIEKLKHRFASIGSKRGGNLTSDHKGKAIVVK